MDHREVTTPKAAPLDVGGPIAVIAALETELTPIRHRLAGAMAAGKVVTKRLGVGGERAEAAVDELIEAYRPIRIIHVGFAGGLDPALEAGEVLRVGRAANEAGKRIEIDSADGREVMLSVAGVVDSVAAKKRLFKQHLAAAVDMESFAVAQCVTRAGIPLTGLRVISDPAGAALPAASIHWITPDGRTRTAPAILWAAIHPWRIAQLIRLGRHAKRARTRLADAVAAEVHKQANGASEAPA